MKKRKMTFCSFRSVWKPYRSLWLEETAGVPGTPLSSIVESFLKKKKKWQREESVFQKFFLLHLRKV